MSPSPIVLTVRARRALTRPAVRRLGVAALAAGTCFTVMSLVAAADDARARWGQTRPVAVATRDLAPGDVVDAGAFEVRDVPEAMLPDAVLDGVVDGPEDASEPSGVTAGDPPVGAVVRHPVLAGEPLVAARLAPHGLTGAAALVPAGWRAVAVPLGAAGAPPVTTGDLVDILAVTPAAAEAVRGQDPAFALVEQALVVDVADDAVTVAVPGDDAPRVAWALSNGAVVLALAGA
ncbi:MAG TPA: SAF domain-containing protein [Acidimicrobiales bacterium]|nr:SAF domain-containing protein [Acidimicrobiales bacterium]